MRTLLLATLLVLAAAPLAPAASASHPCYPEDPLGCSHGSTVCTDWPNNDACPSTLCATLSERRTVCTTRAVCVVGETRCIGYLACVKAACVPDPCYTTACFLATRGVLA